MTEAAAIAVQLSRQAAHWLDAAKRLSRISDLADPDAWAALERQTGVALRENLNTAMRSLMLDAARLDTLRGSSDAADLGRLSAAIVEFRRRYQRTETMFDFYAECVRTRTNPELGALLRASDRLATVSMRKVLEPLGHATPPVLSYTDAGLGAAILKAGLRLWDGRTASSVAAIRVAGHNILRMTSVLHETGHQVAHMLGWTRDIGRRIEAVLPSERAKVWRGWSSEMAADAFAFAHSGYAAVAGLHDVVSGGPDFVFRYASHDPHPISYLRVLLNIEMCRRTFGTGPWDGMAESWDILHPPSRAPERTAVLIGALRIDLSRVAELLIEAKVPAFAGRALSDVVDPSAVSPKALSDLSRRLGASLFHSPVWLSEEPIRALALNGYEYATEPQRSEEITARQKAWMIALGNLQARSGQSRRAARSAA